jgi:hypothetical protein
MEVDELDAEDAKAQWCLTHAMAEYYLDVGDLGTGVTPFHAIPLRTWLWYYNRADHIWCELEDLMGVSGVAGREG